MAAPFIPLGLKAINYVAENHLEKLDDKYFHYSNYKPSNAHKVVPNPLAPLKKRNRRNRNAAVAGETQPEDDASENEDTGSLNRDGEYYEDEQPKAMTGSRAPPPPPPPGTEVEYSREPPRVRDRYLPPSVLAGSAGINAPYYPPPPSYGNGDTYSTPISGARRPRYQSRRSQSHLGHRGRSRYDSDSERSYDSDEESEYARDRQMSRRKDKYFGSGSSGMAHIDRARERGNRYGVKEDIKNSLTDSKVGLAGGALGAAVGAWASSKAQVARGSKEPNPLLTLLGATVGGLAVNAVVDRFEDSKREQKAKEDSWEDKPEKQRRGGRGRGRDRGYESDYE